MTLEEKEKILESAALLRAWETAPDSWSDPYSDMSDIEKSKLLYMLSLRHEEDQKRHEEDQKRHDEDRKRMDKLLASNREHVRLLNQSICETKSLQLQVSDLMKKLEEKDDRIDNLMAELQIYKKNKYDKTSQKRKRKKTPEPPSHEEAKGGFDGTEESLPKTDEKAESKTDTASEQPSTGEDESAKAERLLRGPRGSYNTMDAEEEVLHASYREFLPEGCTYIRTATKKTFDQECRIVKHVYEIIIYKTPDGKIKRGYFPCKGHPVLIDEVPGTHASSSLLAYTAFNRYVLDTPLYREHQRFSSELMRLSDDTLGNWLSKGSRYVMKIVDILLSQALEKDSIINCDETWCRVRCKDGYKKKYIWCVVNRESKIVVYKYADGSRGREVLKDILGNHEIKALQSDGYNVYMYLDDKFCNIEHLCCLAHARAKFLYAYEQCEDPDAKFVLDLIGELYSLEAEYKQANLSPEEITKRRASLETKSKVIELRSKIDQLKSTSSPHRSELMQKAINYIDNYWDQLFAYLKNGRYEIDNSIAERYIRPLAGERKNSLFFGCHYMARVSSGYHTLISTCRAQGISSLNYFKKLFEEIVKGRKDYENLLPATIGVGVNKY